MTKMKKALKSSDVSLELITASRDVGIPVMDELCHSVLSGLGMPSEWALSIVVLIFKYH